MLIRYLSPRHANAKWGTNPLSERAALATSLPCRGLRRFMRATVLATTRFVGTGILHALHGDDGRALLRIASVTPTNAILQPASHCSGHIDRRVERWPSNRPFLRWLEWRGCPYFAKTVTDFSQQNSMTPRNSFLVSRQLWPVAEVRQPGKHSKSPGPFSPLVSEPRHTARLLAA